MTVLLEYIDHSLQFPQMLNIVNNIYYTLPYYMLALWLILSMTHYAQNYAGIIGGSLGIGYVSNHQSINSL